MTVVGVAGIGWQEEAAFDHGALRALTHGRGVGALAHKQLDCRKQRGFAGARFARDHREALRGRERRFANKGDILHVELVEHGETFLECAVARCDGQVPSIIGSWGARLRAARKPKGNSESAWAGWRGGGALGEGCARARMEERDTGWRGGEPCARRRAMVARETRARFLARNESNKKARSIERAVETN